MLGASPTNTVILNTSESNGIESYIGIADRSCLKECPNSQYIVVMNNSTLVNNTDRIYGEQDPLKTVRANEYVETESETSIWLKVIALIVLTYSLIVAFYSLSWIIEKNKGGVDSFVVGGAIILSLFVVYVLIWAFVWYRGSSKREAMKKEAVEAELMREKEADERGY